MGLFRKQDLHQYFAVRSTALERYIHSLSHEVIAANTIEDLVQDCVLRFQCDPVVLQAEDTSRRVLAPTTFERRFQSPLYREAQRIQVSGVRAEFCYPFTGQSDLLQYQASTYSLSPYPNAEIRGDTLVFPYQVELPQNSSMEAEVQQLLQRLQRDHQAIQKAIGWANADASSFNAGIRATAHSQLTTRKGQADALFSMQKLLAIPLQKTPYADTHIPLARREIPLKKSVRQADPSYTISDPDFAYIVDTIRHNCATYERTPGSYQSMKEEDLRNVLLAALNGSYKGLATGEAFRKKGKTDICIEYENRSAFVAECKMWTGAAAIPAAVFQLISYTTWRDCKCALIIFARVKDFQRCCRAASDALKRLQEANAFTSTAPNELQFSMSRGDNPCDRVHVHVLLVDLYCP